MTIRQAVPADLVHVVRSLQNKGISYATTAQARADIQEGKMYVLEENGKIIAQCSLVKETVWNYTAIKRLVIYNKKNCGKGYCKAFISFFCGLGIENLGCTPWKDNAAMISTLTKNGFVFQYQFSENYCWYLRKSS